MSALPFGPYDVARGAPQSGSVQVTALVLTKDEKPNIARCLVSLDWVSPGSASSLCGTRPCVTTGCPSSTRTSGVSAALAREVGDAVAQENLVVLSQRFRLVFLGRWIRHCGWYGGSWVVRLGRRDALSYDLSTPLGERAIVKGKVGRLRCDIVDEDRKGLAAWLRKHIAYAEAESARRVERSGSVLDRLRAVRGMRGDGPGRGHWRKTCCTRPCRRSRWLSSATCICCGAAGGTAARDSSSA